MQLKRSGASQDAMSSQTKFTFSAPSNFCFAISIILLEISIPVNFAASLSMSAWVNAPVPHPTFNTFLPLIDFFISGIDTIFAHAGPSPVAVLSQTLARSSKNSVIFWLLGCIKLLQNFVRFR